MAISYVDHLVFVSFAESCTSNLTYADILFEKTVTFGGQLVGILGGVLLVDALSTMA